MVSAFIIANCLLIAHPSQDVQIGRRGGAKADEMAKKVIEDFMQASWNLKLEEAVTLVDGPFCWDGREIVNERDKLREIVRSMLRRSADPKKVHIRKIGTLAEFKDTLPKRKVSFADVLGSEDRVAFVEIEAEGQLHPLWFAVRIKMKDARIVGVMG